jgi:mannose-6-phosphate isomerase-like protein (cupin superfamily)
MREVWNQDDIWIGRENTIIKQIIGGKMKKVKKTWGYEIWIENNKKYCGKLLHCIKGRYSSKGEYHYHKIKDETFFVIKGTLLLDIEGKERTMTPGEKQRIKPGTKHRFKALTKFCEFVEFSTQHKNEDNYYD